jgi:hypothetical protein
MKPELQDQLLLSYPNLYKKDVYFECGDGWYDLLDRLSFELEPMIIAHEKEHDIHNEFPLYVTQVKEKYGGLRFYTTGMTEEMLEAIEKAEKESRNISE